MDIRPCTRCGKLCPAFASFCRRCGVSMAVLPQPAARPATSPDNSRWASTVASTAMVTLAILLTLFSFPSFRRTCRGHGQRPPHYNVPTDARLLDPAAEGVGEVDGGVNYFGSAGTARADPAEDASASLSSPAPQVIRLAGSVAGAGHKVTIVGATLAGATKVYFVTSDGRAREARFLAWDDGRLVAVVPDLGPRPLSGAVVVSTPDGMTAPAAFFYTGR